MSVIEINESEFNDKITSFDKVLVDCYADWCGPCKMLAPIIEEIAANNDKCNFYKINVDSAGEIVEKYQIMSIPTLLLFEKGELKAKSVGLKSKSELEQFISE